MKLRISGCSPKVQMRGEKKNKKPTPNYNPSCLIAPKDFEGKKKKKATTHPWFIIRITTTDSELAECCQYKHLDTH